MANKEEVFTTDEVQEYLETHVLKDIDLVSPKFHITKGSNEGDNYVGFVHRVTIEGVEKNGANKKLELIVKTKRNITNDWGDMKDNKSSRLFRREIEFYQEILPLFQEIGKKHGGNIAVRCPFLYNASIEFDREVISLCHETNDSYIKHDNIRY